LVMLFLIVISQCFHLIFKFSPSHWLFQFCYCFTVTSHFSSFFSLATSS
jgi:hypothetical protein